MNILETIPLISDIVSSISMESFLKKGDVSDAKI